MGHGSLRMPPISKELTKGCPSGMLTGGTSCRNGQGMDQCLRCIYIGRISSTWEPSLALPHRQLQSAQTRAAPSQPLSAADVRLRGRSVRILVLLHLQSLVEGRQLHFIPGEPWLSSLLLPLAFPPALLLFCPSSPGLSRHSTSTTQRAACPQVIHFFKRRRKWVCCFHNDSHMSWWRDVRSL